MAAAKKIGLFGGTFNPIHLGHLRGAEDIRESFDLDRVIFIPAADPPHKDAREIIDPRHRLEMVKLATSSHPSFSASDVELRRAGRSYSVDTLRYFHKRDVPSALFFILGMDAFLEIETWKEYRELFRLSNFIVMIQPGLERTPASRPLPEGLSPHFRYLQEGACWRHESGHTLHFAEISFLDISSTRIRELLGRGKSVKYLVSSEVEAYIRRHRLYRRKRAAGREEMAG